MSLFRPRKSAEDLGLKMQAEMQPVNGLISGYIIPKLCSHEAVIKYSRGDFSCLAKHLPEQTPSIWHFLSWTAYSNCTSPGVARRQCPLTKCNYTIINDPDKLRSHIFSCAFLSDGRYWCDYCNREERFTPFQCKECPVSPYHKSRLSQKAKRMFRWLGTRSRQKDPYLSTLAAVDKGQPADTALHELGNSITTVEIGGYDEPPAELDSSNFVRPLTRLNNPTLVAQPSPLFSNNHCMTHPPSSPGLNNAHSLQVQLSKRQDFQGPASGRSASEPHSTKGLPKFQSPTYPTSPDWTPEHYVNSNSSSPTETVCSEESLSSKLSSDTSVSSVSTPYSLGTHISTGSFSYGTSTKVATAKNPAIVSMSLPREDRVRRPRSVEESERCCQHPDVLAEFLCSKDCSPLVEPSTPQWLNPEDVVQDFWIVAAKHVEVSMEKLRQLANSMVVRDLLHMTTEVITARGLVTWQRILTGCFPTNVADLVSLLHITYACAMVIYDFHMTSRLQQLFSHALLLEAGALCVDDKALYLSIVKILWKPPVESMIKHGRFVSNHGQSSIVSPVHKVPGYSIQGECNNRESVPAIIQTLRESGNDIFGVLDDFLILIEGAALSRRLSRADTSPQYVVRDRDFVPKVMQSIIYPLIPRSIDSEPSLEAFVDEIRKMEILVQMGRISSIQEVEVGLIWAARRVIHPLPLYEKITDRVKELCVLVGPTDYTSRNERSVHGIDQFRRLLSGVRPKFKVSYICETEKHQASISSRLSSQYSDVTGLSAPDGMENILRYEATTRQVTENHLSNQGTTKRKKTSASDVGGSLSPSTYPIGISAQASDSEQANPNRHICGHRPTGDPKWYRGNLMKHMRTHDNNKFLCNHPGCGRSYGRSDNLSQHIKEHHSGNRWLGGSWSHFQLTESLGKRSGSSYEDTSVFEFNDLGEYSWTSLMHENTPR